MNDEHKSWIKNAYNMVRPFVHAKRKSWKNKNLYYKEKNIVSQKLLVNYLKELNWIHQKIMILGWRSLGSKVNDITTQEEDAEFQNLPYIVSDEVAIKVVPSYGI